MVVTSQAFDLSPSFALGVASYFARLFDFRTSSAFPLPVNYHRIIFFSIENYQLNSILFFRAQLIWRERWKCGRYGLLIPKCRFGILFTGVIIYRFLRVRVSRSVWFFFFFKLNFWIIGTVFDSLLEKSFFLFSFFWEQFVHWEILFQRFPVVWKLLRNKLLKFSPGISVREKNFSRH